MPRIPDPPDEQDDEQFERPIAVGAPVVSASAEDSAVETHSGPWFPESEGGESLSEQPAAPEAVERPRDELLVGIACALLAASVFLPWYHTFFARNLSGWASGTWGPAIFFLALAGVAIVALRRMKISVAFPFDHSLILEGIGWVSVAMTFIKRFFPPHIGQVKDSINTWPMLLSMFAAVAVALLGGRVSSGAPFVMRPGWFADRAGKLGAAILIVAILLGAGFGLTVGSSKSAVASGGNSSNVKQTAGFPQCAKDAKFPKPLDFTATLGMEIPSTATQGSSCVVAFTAPLTLRGALGRIESALRAGGWTFAEQKTGLPAQYASILLKSPRCGAVSVQQGATPSPSKSGKTTPKPVVSVQASFYSHCGK